jgi:hypothetical protein
MQRKKGTGKECLALDVEADDAQRDDRYSRGL